MAIKRVQAVTYVTDRGLELDLRQMTASHLMNAIAHHQKQIDAISGHEQQPLIRKRIDGLNYTIGMLLDELATRDPDQDYPEGELSRTWEKDY